MDNKIVQTLIGLKNTLNLIEIKGEQNFGLMLGSLKAIDNLLTEINKESELKNKK